MLIFYRIVIKASIHNFWYNTAQIVSVPIRKLFIITIFEPDLLLFIIPVFINHYAHPNFSKA